MASKPRAKTIGALQRSKYRPTSVRHEIRRNLIAKIKRGERLFPGVIGYDDTVIPQLENALLAGQDVILLGERGQAKSRLIRSLVTLLDEFIPAIQGCEITDNPFAPVCKECRIKIEEAGNEVEIRWVDREERYSEKLATPDTSIADLIGEVDPIKVAEGHYLSDEYAIHYGLIPRTNRGIFSINELPDLPERVQVGMFTLMEERDVQIKGYRIRMPLDLFVVATANPEDYTNRGRIITPLKDRYGAQIRTHYPQDIWQELQIMDQERSIFPGEESVFVPSYIKEIIAEITALARKSPEINQRSGVSVRVSIANLETVISNATRRAIRLKEKWVVPRISDLPFILPSFGGKIELESFEEGREGKILEELCQRAVLNVFGRYFQVSSLDPVTQSFQDGRVVDVGNQLPARSYLKLIGKVNGLSLAIERMGCNEYPETQAAVVEFVLEGLYLNRKLNRDRVGGGLRYSQVAPRRVTQQGQ